MKDKQRSLRYRYVLYAYTYYQSEVSLGDLQWNGGRGGAFSTPFPVKIKTLIAYENKLTPPPPNQAQKKCETIFIRFFKSSKSATTEISMTKHLASYNFAEMKYVVLRCFRAFTLKKKIRSLKTRFPSYYVDDYSVYILYKWWRHHVLHANTCTPLMYIYLFTWLFKCLYVNTFVCIALSNTFSKVR